MQDFSAKDLRNPGNLRRADSKLCQALLQTFRVYLAEFCGFEPSGKVFIATLDNTALF